MTYSRPITEIIRQRFSCRTYLERPIEEEKRKRLQEEMALLRAGPLRDALHPAGAPLRFVLVAATEQDREALRGLGTYGFIRGASGFIVGAVGRGVEDLEGYGYAMERLILLATDLGLGTCWLGGFFSRGRFADKVSATEEEQVPAVAAVGIIADVARARNTLLRRQIHADSRLPWEKLFFRGGFGVPLGREEAGACATPLEMVRLGPSASNKQPWRLVQDGNDWHFYLQRTRGYGRGLASALLRIADIQRLDMGIAMCHFELTTRELGLRGGWVVHEPAIAKPDELTEYTVSWVSA